MSAPITRYMQSPNGGRNLGVQVLGVDVLVKCDHESEQPIADRVAESIGSIDALLTRAEGLESERQGLVDRIRGLEMDIAVLTGDARSRWFGEVIARIDELDGSIWLMNKPEQGWSSAGFRVAGWAELARAWPELRPWGVGQDEHGWFLRLRSITRQVMPGGRE